MLNSKLTKLLFALAVVGSFVVTALAERDDDRRGLKVMTYNMYAGTDFTGIFLSQSPEELVSEVAEAFTDVQANSPSERIDEIADQIAAERPDLVGLQEVALWRVGAPFDPSPAEGVAYDFLEILLARLAARNKHYRAIAVQENLDAELPAVFGPTSALDVRFTDRVVILARTDRRSSRTRILETNTGTFAVNLPIPLLGGEVIVKRGWATADVRHDGKNFRFVNTHLESFNEQVQYAQAFELLQVPANTRLPVVLLGDFNSDAATNGQSYSLLISGGFRDMWKIQEPFDAGFTWPLSDESTSVFLQPTQRLDLILTRGKARIQGFELKGEDSVRDLTISGQRPSDHAGVAATIELKHGRGDNDGDDDDDDDDDD